MRERLAGLPSLGDTRTDEDQILYYGDTRL